MVLLLRRESRKGKGATMIDQNKLVDLATVEDIALLVEVQLLRSAWSDVERAAMRQYIVHLLRALTKFNGGQAE